ncbi:MAG: sugar phosphorylase [Chloroflexi bacterium]|nr:sugar phosphorylase [Chloroflexota bacterium]
MDPNEQRLYEHLSFIYGEDQASNHTERLCKILTNFAQDHPKMRERAEQERISERDTILITYGDMVQEDGKTPLQTLAELLKDTLAGVVSTVHILPFFPYSSDDGFAVIDYQKVNPDLGTWDDIRHIRTEFRLMFDAVINHVSAESEWFQGFLRDDPKYRHYFTVIEEGADLSMVFRPRSSPLLTPVQTATGEKMVWTTFSADQIDLNYKSPELLFDILNILLFYVSNGAEFIRLDAVTFLWKEIGTPSINMPQTHRIIQLLRTALDIAAPHVTLITETNVPHKDNISYFGDGTNEAQMVYNFALPILTVHAFLKSDAQTLSKWAATLDLPSDKVNFFNLLAGHDGIGMLPVKDILDDSDIAQLVEHTQSLGGNISYKSNQDGTLSPYELNINFFDLLQNPDQADEELELATKRFLTSQAIMLSLRGVPGIYFHSLFGSRNWEDGVEMTSRYRTINREKLQRSVLETELDDTTSLRNHIFYGYLNMLTKRRNCKAFHPRGRQIILTDHNAIFGLVRISPDGQNRALCLHNVSNQTQTIRIDLHPLPLDGIDAFKDLLSGDTYPLEERSLSLTMEPFQVLWLQSGGN